MIESQKEGGFQSLTIDEDSSSEHSDEESVSKEKNAVSTLRNSTSKLLENQIKETEEKIRRKYAPPLWYYQRKWETGSDRDSTRYYEPFVEEVQINLKKLLADSIRAACPNQLFSDTLDKWNSSKQKRYRTIAQNLKLQWPAMKRMDMEVLSQRYAALEAVTKYSERFIDTTVLNACELALNSFPEISLSPFHRIYRYPVFCTEVINSINKALPDCIKEAKDRVCAYVMRKELALREDVDEVAFVNHVDQICDLAAYSMYDSILSKVSNVVDLLHSNQKFDIFGGEKNSKPRDKLMKEMLLYYKHREQLDQSDSNYQVIRQVNDLLAQGSEEVDNLSIDDDEKEKLFIFWRDAEVLANRRNNIVSTDFTKSSEYAAVPTADKTTLRHNVEKESAVVEKGSKKRHLVEVDSAEHISKKQSKQGARHADDWAVDDRSDDRSADPLVVRLKKSLPFEQQFWEPLLKSIPSECYAAVTHAFEKNKPNLFPLMLINLRLNIDEMSNHPEKGLLRSSLKYNELMKSDSANAPIGELYTLIRNERNRLLSDRRQKLGPNNQAELKKTRCDDLDDRKSMDLKAQSYLPSVPVMSSSDEHSHDESDSDYLDENESNIEMDGDHEASLSLSDVLGKALPHDREYWEPLIARIPSHGRSVIEAAFSKQSSRPLYPLMLFNLDLNIVSDTRPLDKGLFRFKRIYIETKTEIGKTSLQELVKVIRSKLHGSKKYRRLVPVSSNGSSERMGMDESRLYESDDGGDD